MKRLWYITEDVSFPTLETCNVKCIICCSWTAILMHRFAILLIFFLLTAGSEKYQAIKQKLSINEHCLSRPNCLSFYMKYKYFKLFQSACTKHIPTAGNVNHSRQTFNKWKRGTPSLFLCNNEISDFRLNGAIYIYIRSLLWNSRAWQEFRVMHMLLCFRNNGTVMQNKNLWDWARMCADKFVVNEP